MPLSLKKKLRSLFFGTIVSMQGPSSYHYLTKKKWNNLTLNFSNFSRTSRKKPTITFRCFLNSIKNCRPPFSKRRFVIGATLKASHTDAESINSSLKIFIFTKDMLLIFGRKGTRYCWLLRSSKELGFFNPRSQLDTPLWHIAPYSSKMGRTGKGEWEREGATLVEGRGKKSNPSRVYIE